MFLKPTVINLKVLTYSHIYKPQWDAFVATSKNATFLFKRDFMEYHNVRFTDYSLLVFDNSKLVALLPANLNKDSVHSHQGLSYGGFILQPKVKFSTVLNIVKTVLHYLNAQNIAQLVLKKLPDYYTTLPAQEIDYLLFLLKAKNRQRSISSVIDLTASQLPMSTLRKRGVKKAQKNGLIIKEESTFTHFWNQILTPNLERQHNVKPVHSLEEIKLLAGYFPKNIKQFNVYQNDTIVGGTTIFETQTTAHVQYISAGSNKQELGTLDYLFYTLITCIFSHKHYFDFGISTEAEGKQVNQGLLQWKESFGARSFVNNTYEIKTENYKLLDSVFI